MLVCLQLSSLSGLDSDSRHLESFLSAVSQVFVPHGDCWLSPGLRWFLSKVKMRVEERKC